MNENINDFAKQCAELSTKIEELKKERRKLIAHWASDACPHLTRLNHDREDKPFAKRATAYWDEQEGKPKWEVEMMDPTTGERWVEIGSCTGEAERVETGRVF